MIAESHQELMNYVDIIDQEVKKIVSTYESEFLSAYQKYYKKVRQELTEMKKQAMEALHSNKQYIDRIDWLEKQCVLFRDQNLDLS